jgi:hypothetical protein
MCQYGLWLVPVDAGAHGVGVVLEPGVDGGGVNIVQRLHRDGDCSAKEGIGRFDAIDVSGQQLKCLRGTTDGQCGVHGTHPFNKALDRCLGQPYRQCESANDVPMARGERTI